MGFNWRPDYDPAIVNRELEIIRDDLHCNAVRICGLDIERLAATAEDALRLNLEVWFSPEMWDKAPEQTLSYVTNAAARAEKLRSQWPDKIVFSVGSELTLFMQGIIPGKTFGARMKNPDLLNLVKAGEHNKPLNDFLGKANAAVRGVFHGKVTYASLVWEAVDWSLFDLVGVDHYRIKNIEDKYVEFLKPSFSSGKPVVITEFGYGTGEGGIGSQGFLGTSGLSGGIIDLKSQFLHYAVPILGRFVKPRVVGNPVRNESWQASKLIENLKILDDSGVDGAFIFQFISQITPYSDDPKYDLDIASSSLVKYYEHRGQGNSYPDMPWEPKESFRAVAEYYASH
jgi:hypothetical protein